MQHNKAEGYVNTTCIPRIYNGVEAYCQPTSHICVIIIEHSMLWPSPGELTHGQHWSSLALASGGIYPVMFFRICNVLGMLLNY